MQSLLIAVLSAIGFLLAYHLYGRWLGRRIFRLSGEARCPSHAFRDDADFCPTHPAVVFGHHFTSIAGTGPIVGPAIAILWGWLPALVWVLLGSVFIGAVHDFGSLVVSLRNNGQTVGDIAGRMLNPRVRLLFLLVLFMALTIVLAIFGLVIAAVFRQYPSSIMPCTLQIPIAVAIGYLIHRKGGKLLIPSLVALTLMYVTVVYGNVGFLAQANAWLAALPIATWVLLLLIYSYIASVLPVWILLQPRDYINSLQLLSALGLVLLGLVAAALFGGAAGPDGVRQTLEISAPAVNWNPKGAPPIFPFLFVTVACGAVSGFHCLVSSGTSSKQLGNETEARLIGFGSMLTEGFLAVLVILACAAGLGLGVADKAGVWQVGEAAWLTRYSSWAAADGLGAKVGAFVDGSANFLAAIGIGRDTAIALMGVLVASFAATTLDTACRLQRYVIEELAGIVSPKSPAGKLLRPLRNKHGATIFAVLAALYIAMIPPQGQVFSWASAGRGGQILWPLFGATNQLLGGMAFLVIAFYLWRRRQPLGFLLLPMVFMLIMPLWAMTSQIFVGDGILPGWWQQKNFLLAGIGIVSILLEVWMIVEALLLLPKTRGVLETPAPPPAHAFK
jgi:carbon starvation protein